MWMIGCECGWTFRSVSSDELVAAMQRHVTDAHPELPKPPSRADVLAMAEET
jgi:hypothetical protein